ncbi:MAG: Spy/CpxP family protein refolding chaperone [Acidobacteriota bacterium]|nr:Spy/CpxP family protein refolding chaperone [Acidobacteriota bacterium]MDQ5872340.1 Spy/CpxP family protein refolding chaperone [Acidobacteriota bacterium]
MRIPIAFAGLVTLLATPLFSQETRPYSGEESREIKALSPEEIESYRTGAGMGFAKAAELNHYPGPKHVLELASEIGLSASQKKETQWAYDAMHAQTVGLGERLVVAERGLDGLFAAEKIDEASLARSVREIARLQGEIRLEHLKAHLAMRALLTPAQVAKYDALRGYGSGEHDPSRHRH